MKTKSKELLPIWDELQDIFNGFSHWNQTITERLEKLGFKIRQTKHPIITFNIHGKEHHVVACSSPSDNYAGKQILRQIRREFENDNSN